MYRLPPLSGGLQRGARCRLSGSEEHEWPNLGRADRRYIDGIGLQVLQCLCRGLPDGSLARRTHSAVQQRAAVAPCTTACPAGIDVPRYVQLAGLGRFAEANALVREKLPFPGILGRACYAPCESDCRRGNLDDPLSIRSLKRIAAEHDDGQWRVLQRRDVPTGRRVAVIGAEPAGLTAAFYLAKKGHAVTVFEALPDAGGMARYGIPAYRLWA